MALENATESPGITREALDKLTDRRLLRIEDRGGMQRLELTHDVLTGVIRKSRDQRREREAGEREEAARRVAERKLRRSQLIIALLGLVLLGVIALAVWGLHAENKASEALASSYVEKASSLKDSNPSQALAYLAQAIREDPESVPAQSHLIDLLLYRSWPRPVAELRHADAEWVQLSDDGHLFVTASEGGGKLRIWDTQTLRKVGEVRQDNIIESIEISRDGRRLLIISPGAAELWDTRTSKRLWHAGLGNEVPPRLSPDGRWLARIRDRQTWIHRQTLVLLDNTTRQEREITTDVFPVKFAFSPDSRRILVEASRKLSFWDLESGRSLPAPKEDSFELEDVVLTPDSRYLLVPGLVTTNLLDLEKQIGKEIGGTADRGWLSPGGERAAVYHSEELRVWNTTYHRELATIPKRKLLSAEFSRDGRRLLTTSEEGVELWDADNGLPVGQAFCECLHARFLAGTRQIVTGDDSGVLRVWSPELAQTGTELYSAGAKMHSYSLDGSRLAIQTGDDKIHLWDMDAVRPLEAPIGNATPSWFGLSSDGRFLYEINERTFQIWDTRTRQLAWPALTVPKSRTGWWRYRFNTAHEILGSEEGNTIELWNFSTGKQSGKISHDQRVTDFAFTPGGDLVTTLANNVFTWDSQTGKPLSSAFGYESAVTAFDFSPDGKWLATGTEHGLVRIQDLRSGQLLVGPLRHQDRIDSVQFDPGGRLLLTYAKNLLRLWDSRTGQPKSVSVRTEGEIQSAQLSPDGVRVLVNTDQEPGVLLDARTGQLFLASPVSGDALLSSAGQLLWVASSGQVHVFAVPHFPRQDRELLARWAEAVGGWAVGEEGQLVELRNQLARREALRRETADAPPGQLRAASLIRWFLSDPKTRPVSPVFERTIDLSGDTHPQIPKYQ